MAASAGEGFDLDRGDDRNFPPARALQADRKVLRHRHINHTGKGGAAVRVRGCDRPWGGYQHDATDLAAADPRPATRGRMSVVEGMSGFPRATLVTKAEAVAASLACARAVGLSVDHAEVIAEGYSVRVRLHPAPVVTLVVTIGRELRGDPGPWLTRQVAVAQFLSASEVADDVVGPWEDPGPHLVEGIEVSL